MFMHEKQARMWKKLVVAYLKVISLLLLRGTEENHRKFQE
jgi:hypothetical protein